MKTLTVAAIVLFSAGAAAQGQVYKAGPGITNPVVIKDVKPSYTAEAMRAKIQGQVELEGVVGVDGRISDVQVITSLDKVYGLDSKAIEAVSKWVFKPGMREGKPVPVRVTVALTFTLRDYPIFDSNMPEVKAPLLVTVKQPVYTREAIADRIEGVVELEGIVQAGGAVADIRVVKGLDPGLDANAVAAFKGYGYKPATLAGRPVHYRVRVQILFTLKK